MNKTMSKNNRKIISVVLLFMVTCISISCTTNNYYPVNKVIYSNADSSVKEICDSIEIDINTVGTTTDPE